MNYSVRIVTEWRLSVFGVVGNVLGFQPGVAGSYPARRSSGHGVEVTRNLAMVESSVQVRLAAPVVRTLQTRTDRPHERWLRRVCAPYTSVVQMDNTPRFERGDCGIIPCRWCQPCSFRGKDSALRRRGTMVRIHHKAPRGLRSAAPR